MQDSLFPDPLGVRLRIARESVGLSREAAARALRLPTVIIDALEREDWQRLGAPIYVRAHLSAYLKLLELPPTLVDSATSVKPAPHLAAMASRSRLQSMVERGLRKAVYAVMTAAIAVPVAYVVMHYDSREKLSAAFSLEPSTVASSSTPAKPVPIQVTEKPRVTETTRAAIEESPLAAVKIDPSQSDVSTAQDSDALPETAHAPPVVASMAPFAATDTAAPDTTSTPMTPSSTAGEVHLQFTSESWLEVLAENGETIERGLISAGSQRILPTGQGLRITLGNAEAVTVVRDGAAIDLAPYRSANVARFAVSSTSEVSSAGR